MCRFIFQRVRKLFQCSNTDFENKIEDVRTTSIMATTKNQSSVDQIDPDRNITTTKKTIRIMTYD